MFNTSFQPVADVGEVVTWEENPDAEYFTGKVTRKADILAPNGRTVEHVTFVSVTEDGDKVFTVPTTSLTDTPRVALLNVS